MISTALYMPAPFPETTAFPPTVTYTSYEWGHIHDGTRWNTEGIHGTE